MIFTTDRVQFKNETFIVFEFFNFEKEQESKRFIEEKMKFLKNSANFDICYAIAHDSKYEKFVVVTYDNLRNERIETELSLNEYIEWFQKLNGTSTHSKPLGSAKPEIGDKYVQNILNIINKEYEFDFSNDDNGLELTTKVLSKKVTTGFDFDLIETESKSIIEFLKRENKYLDNKTAHPARYQRNHQKFTSLWNARNRINGELFLVNYSTEGSEKDNYLSVIKVIDYSEKEGRIISDIGYLLNGFEELIDWLYLLKNTPEKADEFLLNRKKQVRSEEWWRAVYCDFDRYKKNIGNKYI